MNKIIKAKETMTSRERVLNTFHFAPVDRLAMDYSANPLVHQRLAKSLCLKDDDYEGVFQALGIDYRNIGVPYIGKKLFEEKTGYKTDPVYGCRTRWIENESGGYEDFCAFPLENASDEEIASFPVANPDDFDYSEVVNMLKHFNQYGLYVGNPGFADIINATGRVMGMEQTLINLLTEDEATLQYIKNRCDMEIGILDRILSKSKNRIDFLYMGEDLGTQNSQLIGLDLYRKVIKPMHKRYTDLAKSYGIPVMMHSCGYSSWAYNDMIEIGVNAIDTLQPEAKNMSPTYLKEHFSGKLSFHGCISTAGPLAYGTTEDVIKNVNETIDIMKIDGGYHFAPTHMIQDNTPTENIIAMYQAAHNYCL